MCDMCFGIGTPCSQLLRVFFSELFYRYGRAPVRVALADDGILFERAYTVNPVCAPARSTLMTGTHMGHTSVRGNSGGKA